MKKLLYASALAALATWFTVFLVAVSGAPVPPSLSTRQVHDWSSSDVQEISGRALGRFDHVVDSAASEASDISDYSWPELHTSDSNRDSSPILDDESVTSGSKRKLGALTSEQRDAEQQAGTSTQTVSPLSTSSSSQASRAAGKKPERNPLWLPEMEADWHGFIWSDRDVAQLSSPKYRVRKAAWERLRYRKEHDPRNAGPRPGRESESSTSADRQTRFPTYFSRLQHNAYKKIKRLEASKPDPSDVIATARWQQRMDAELAVKGAFRPAPKARAYEKAKDPKLQNDEQLLRGSERPREADFVGLTEHELRLFGSEDSKDRTKLRNRINSRIWRAESGEQARISAATRQAKLRADKAWFELLDSLKGMSRRDTRARIAEIMAKVQDMPSEQAAEHVAGVVERLGQSSSSAQANKTRRADSSSGGALETLPSPRQQADSSNKSTQQRPTLPHSVVEHRLRGNPSRQQTQAAPHAPDTPANPHLTT